MDTRADRLSPLPEHVSRIAVRRRVWNGVCVDVSEHWGSGDDEGCHELCYEGAARVTGLIEEAGDAHCEPRVRASLPCPVEYVPRNIQFMPAGMTIWGYSAALRYVKDVTLVFTAGPLEERLGEKLDPGLLSTPRLRFADERLWPLLKLLSEAVDDRDPSSELYGDGLIAAAAARLLCERAEQPSAAAGLAPWQLRRVLDYLDAHLPARVELARLAALAGLSQAHFARAFRASTGVAPYRWQLQARIDRARTLLLRPDCSLEDVAAATGFADAVHLGRTFRKLTGATPAAWRRIRLG